MILEYSYPERPPNRYFRYPAFGFCPLILKVFYDSLEKVIDLHSYALYGYRVHEQITGTTIGCYLPGAG